MNVDKDELECVLGLKADEGVGKEGAEEASSAGDQDCGWCHCGVSLVGAGGVYEQCW